MENCKYKLIFKDGGEGITFPSISLNETENYSFEDFVNFIDFELTERHKEVLKVEWDIKEMILATQEKKFNNR